MNKFAAFAVLAIAALACSAAPIDEFEGEEMTQAALITTNDEETAALGPKGLEAFNDFCISSRDYVLADMKRQSNDMSSQVFGLLVGTAAAIGKEAVNVEMNAAERLSKQLANPSAAVEPSDDAIDQIIIDGQNQIQGQNAAYGIVTAFKTAVSAVSSRVGSLVSGSIANLKAYATPAQLVAAMNKGCDEITKYEVDLRQQFEEYKQSSLGADAEKYAKLSMEAVPCATSTKIIRGEGLCDLARKITNPVKKILATRA